LLIRAHFRCRRTGQDKKIDERLTSVENYRDKDAQRKDEINATLARLDNIIATWDAVFKETKDRLEASRSSKAAELALFGNATKALKDAVSLFKSGKVAGNDDDEEEDPAYEASGYAGFRKMWAEWFKRPRTFRMCNFILGRSPSDLIGMGGITIVAIVGYTVAVSFIAVAKLNLENEPFQLSPFHNWSVLGAGISSLVFSLAAPLSVIDPSTTLSETLKITSQSIVWSFTILSFVWAGRIAMEVLLRSAWNVKGPAQQDE